MATKTFTQLTAYASTLAASDEVPIWDASAAAARKMTVANFIANTPNGGLAELGAANVFTANQRVSALVGVNVAPTTGQQLTVLAGSTSTVGMVVDTPASPTANLAEFRNNGTAKFYVNANGAMTALGLNINTGITGGGGEAQGGIYYINASITTSYGTVIASHVFGSLSVTSIKVDLLVALSNNYEGGGLTQDSGIRTVAFTSKTDTPTTTVGSTVVTLQWTQVSGATYKLEAACTGGSGTVVLMSGLAIVKGGVV